MVDDKKNKVMTNVSQQTANTKKSPGSANKAIETMFRNAYRAQLDLLALAATKANIMISLNGAIVSILMVASGFVYADAKNPTVLLPAALFLITSVVSIYFALSAASPSPSPPHTHINNYFNNMLKNNFNFLSTKNDTTLSVSQFKQEASNILIFEDFSKLSKIDYIDQMQELMSNKERVYNEMSAQLHHLGTMADRKYAMLRHSYSVFRWGVIITIVVFLFLQYFSSTHTQGLILSPLPSSSDSETSTLATNSSDKKESHHVISTPAIGLQTSSGILSFTSIYEPSGVQQLPDGRLIVIEDESERAFRILTLSKDLQVMESKPLDTLSVPAFEYRLNDLEAITIGPDNYLYAITSHKLNDNGKRKPSREQLIRFKIQGTTLTDVSVVTHLIDSIKSSKALDSITKKNKQSIDKINIEALSFDKNNHLLVGLRKPTSNGNAIILSIENPIAIFTDKEKIKVAEKSILLDLHGGGIRAIRYIPKLSGYLIANEIKNKDSKSKKQSQISFWDGNSDHLIKPFTLHRLDKIDNVEGISPIVIKGKEYILLVGDNGSSESQQPANFLLLDYI
jgi:hypothetical protein